MPTTFEYRIYPTKAQTETLESQLDACRNIYNQSLAWRKDKYEKEQESVKYSTQQAALTPLRKESPFFASLHIDILQDALRRLDKAYKAFFRRIKNGEKPGYPRFKGVGRYRSMTFSHLSKNLICEIGGRLARVVVPRLGKVKIRYHRSLPDGKIKTLTIQKKASGWYACIAVEVPDLPKVEIQNAIGIDVGLESFLTTSDGEKVENPRHLRRAEERLKRKQRKVSRRQKGSHRRRKIVQELAKQHEHVANQRKDFHYKTAHHIFSRYDAVVVEDLKITNMVKNHRLAKSISDAAWGNFRLALESKAENAGRHLLKVPPHGTSQECSSCSEAVKKTLDVRVHRCDCGLVLDRDHNAAINIYKRAASVLRGGVSDRSEPEKPSNEGRGPREIPAVRSVRAFQQAPTDCLFNQWG
jgi:putative transposase